ncbi:MAG: glycosyltransferase family 39 protein [Flavobacteriales bacterium]|nr:glycosyltransferase family 39 protein [Flavobacteriales bacterium]
MSYFTSSSGASRRRRDGRRSGGTRRPSDRPASGAWAQLRFDVRDARARYGKQTSVAHKRFVILLVLLGAAFRVALLFEPITASEALACMSFTLQPVGTIISDYSLPVNHVLHTLLAKASMGLFGVGTVALRLPAVLAAILALPLFYLFVRSLFNRYIALMALAMAAGFPAQAELGALAHGYSITWCAMLAGLLLGRHLVRERNWLTALLLGLSLALGMWATPSMIFPALMVLLWVLFSLLAKYERSLNDRLLSLGLTIAVFLLTTMLLYVPIVLAHGIDQLFNHVTEGELSWKEFRTGYPDKVLELWSWVVDPTTGWVALLGLLSLVHAAYISVKYRVLLLALVLGAVPLTLLFARVAPPWDWAYALFIFHIGSSIALFYLLKFVQDRIAKGFGKRTRTGWAALVLIIGFAVPGYKVVRDRPERMGEARSAVTLLSTAMQPGDRLCATPYWENALRFEWLSRGVDEGKLRGDPGSGHLLFTMLQRPTGPAYDVALLNCELRADQFEQPAVVKDWPRMEIFAARKR